MELSVFFKVANGLIGLLSMMAPPAQAGAGSASRSTGDPSSFQDHMREAMAGTQSAESVRKPQAQDAVQAGKDVEKVVQEVAKALEGLDPAQLAQVARKLAAVEAAAKQDPDGGAAALAAFWSELLAAIVALQQGAGSLDAEQVAALIGVLAAQALGEDAAPVIEAARQRIGDEGVREILQAMRDAKPVAQEDAKPVEEDGAPVAEDAPVTCESQEPVATQESVGDKPAPRDARGAAPVAKREQAAGQVPGPEEVAPDARVETEVETQGRPVVAGHPTVKTQVSTKQYVEAEGAAQARAATPVVAQEAAWTPAALVLRDTVLSKLQERLTDVADELPRDVVRLVRMIEKALQDGPVQAEAAAEAAPEEKAAKPVLPRGQVPVQMKDGGKVEHMVADRRAMDAYGQRPAPQLFKVVLAKAEAVLPAVDAPAEAARKSAEGLATPVLDADASATSQQAVARDAAQAASAAKSAGTHAVDPKIVHQVMESAKESIRVWVRRNMTAMEVRIEPPEMGKIQIKTVVHEGRLGTLIVTDTPAARDILLANSDELKAILKQSGLSMAGFGIELQQKDQERDLPNRRPARPFSMEELLREEDPTEEERSGLINKVA